MKILNFHELHQLLNVSRSTLARWEKAGYFPKRTRLGPGTVGWREEEVLAWLESRPRGMVFRVPGQSH